MKQYFFLVCILPQYYSTSNQNVFHIYIYIFFLLSVFHIVMLLIIKNKTKTNIFVKIRNTQTIETWTKIQNPALTTYVKKYETKNKKK